METWSAPNAFKNGEPTMLTPGNIVEIRPAKINSPQKSVRKFPLQGGMPYLRRLMPYGNLRICGPVRQAQ